MINWQKLADPRTGQLIEASHGPGGEVWALFRPRAVSRKGGAQTLVAALVVDQEADVLKVQTIVTKLGFGEGLYEDLPISEGYEIQETFVPAERQKLWRTTASHALAQAWDATAEKSEAMVEGWMPPGEQEKFSEEVMDIFNYPRGFFGLEGQ